MSPFKQKVLKAVERIPYGRVASYGQIALIIGFPRGAREVGWILNNTEKEPHINIPWWRVINNTGRITIKGAMFASADLQRKILRAEGIEISETFTLDIEQYRWRPNKEELKNLELTNAYVQKVIEKYGV